MKKSINRIVEIRRRSQKKSKCTEITMESLKELEKWRDDPKNWVGSNSSESVNCTFLLENLLDNLFHPTDQWSIVLEFLGVGRADFYQDPCESCK